MNKLTALIFMRSDSTRLPRKHERKVYEGTTLCKLLMQNLDTIPDLHKVICTTKDTPHNYCIYDNDNIPRIYWEGNPNHIGCRIIEAADKYPSEYYVIISADCPLIDHEYVMNMVNMLDSNPYYDACCVPNGGLHVGAEVLRGSSVSKIIPSIDKLSLKYHNLNYIESNTLYDYGDKKRLTVDNLADMRFLNECYNIVGELTYSKLLYNKDLPTYINIHCKSHQTKSSNLLLITEGGSDIGMGHVARTIAHYQLQTEINNNGCLIMCNNNIEVIKMLQSNGLIKNLDFFSFNAEFNVDEYDATYIDTPCSCWFNHQVYIDNPTYLVNRKVYEYKYLKSEPFSDVLVYFGEGSNNKYISSVIDANKLVDRDFVIYDKQVPIYKALNGSKCIYTMWSQTAREALVLDKDVYVYTSNPEDDYVCEKLDKRGVLTWLGNILDLTN